MSEKKFEYRYRLDASFCVVPFSCGLGYSFVDTKCAHRGRREEGTWGVHAQKFSDNNWYLNAGGPTGGNYLSLVCFDSPEEAFQYLDLIVMSDATLELEERHDLDPFPPGLNK